MKSVLIKNAKIVNEGTIFEGDVLIENEFIVEIAETISAKSSSTKIINAEGNYLIPGAIDDQVHFREPGLTHKGDIASESRAAVAGGITSFIEMPNTNPQATTIELLEDKFKIASEKSIANYSFMFGGTNDNLEEILKVNPKTVAGLKLFLGSSTGNMLVDNDEVLEKIFASTPLLIAVHCEDETTIKNNLAKYKEEYGDDIPMKFHHLIRSEEACYLSSSKAIELAKKTGARLHVFHLSTAKEMKLFTNKIPLEEKKITAEACIHHLWFTNEDYDKKGSLIKWNPAVKTQADKDALWEALLDDRIDVIATDHAPHTLEEKKNPYTSAPSGGPLVQHAVVAMFEAFHQGKISVEKIVEKMAHNPAKIFKINKRGFIKEGYYADLAIVNAGLPWSVKKENILYKCGWSPFEGYTFKSRITHTFVNGELVYNNFKVKDVHPGMRLEFDR
ncbi:dihydroorotase [Flavobacterium lindanitolerans]|uniref:Dihydroorotase n=1 Tax=Flavobacterium lindanitolerans TaxID=428988 RepID=A0A497UYK8_9FLAO|nr:dihydroorotase [Flavobacterium lindanitolerans]MBU7569969.1 dihydroorotase [Flavobacterium sp.]PZO34539.1 MAG: dihydroorotase [Flavobacteriaceae bacterium]THD33193.1 MAG: dihydroorotase [Flavobacterium johnsoniae]MBL7868316.1 dihydroorotase [Flavobacterium lindanitolerans]PKW28623.1 dihydroorotase [Flavobacterium lindanitolerans]